MYTIYNIVQYIIEKISAKQAEQRQCEKQQQQKLVAVFVVLTFFLFFYRLYIYIVESGKVVQIIICASSS